IFKTSFDVGKKFAVVGKLVIWEGSPAKIVLENARRSDKTKELVTRRWFYLPPRRAELEKTYRLLRRLFKEASDLGLADQPLKNDEEAPDETLEHGPGAP
ncbi:MAG: hypothetical protein V1787_06055, partial [Candidatus Micrarchaeota archaeon]